MTANTQSEIRIEDSPDLKNVFIQIDLKKGKTLVLSNFSAWENLGYLMEALALTAEKCISEGVPKKKVYDGIKEYLINVLGDYSVLK